MNDYITLLGADDVRSAGYKMTSAADSMNRAASAISEALERHKQYLEEWISRFEVALDKEE